MTNTLTDREIIEGLKHVQSQLNAGHALILEIALDRLRSGKQKEAEKNIQAVIDNLKNQGE